MKFFLISEILISIFLSTSILGQSGIYKIKPASFSSPGNDEFSPVYYKGGIVFCSNRNPGYPNLYSTNQNKGMFKIFYVNSESSNPERAILFSRDLSSDFNDGPVSFSKKGTEIYYSRNLIGEGKLKDFTGQKNKLGIFSARLIDGKWSKIQEFRFNNEWYNITSPAISPDAQYIYFASDKPGGVGGFDLYYCQWKDDYWDNPVNLGPVINSPGNELYPFVTAGGELFFSSDGHGGLGRKDIFFSEKDGNEWKRPVGLDPPINSPADDFALITDSLMTGGYFSSNRGKSLDIFQFKISFPQFFYCDTLRSNLYCYKFGNEEVYNIKNSALIHEWDFGNGNKVEGETVNFCFSNSGHYPVKFNLIDKKSGRLFFNLLSFDLILKDVERAFILAPLESTVGLDVAFRGQLIGHSGRSDLNYYWDFGDGIKSMGEKTQHSFLNNGNYKVKLYVATTDSNGIPNSSCVFTRINISDPSEPSNIHSDKKKEIVPAAKSIFEDELVQIRNRINTIGENNQETVFRVVLLESKTRVNIPVYFRKVPTKYYIREIISQDSLYTYIAGEEFRLESTYNAFRELTDLGIRTVIQAASVTDPAEKEIFNLKRVYGLSSDDFFVDNSARLSTRANLLLDQIYTILKMNQRLSLEFDVHTDNATTSKESMSLSIARAQALVSYLVRRGIPSSRLSARGYGDIKPIAPNNNPENRKTNRRIDYLILNSQP